jgi:hypothetical protein
MIFKGNEVRLLFASEMTGKRCLHGTGLTHHALKIADAAAI